LNEPLQVVDVFLLGLNNAAKFRVLRVDEILSLQEQLIIPTPQSEGDKGWTVQMKNRDMEPPGFRKWLDSACAFIQAYMRRDVVSQRVQNHMPNCAVVWSRIEVSLK
jgi:hypothetical protein